MGVRGEGGWGLHGPPYIFFFIHKNGKSTRSWHILKSNSTSFQFLKKFPRMNNKNFRERGPKRPSLLFLYEVSIVVIIDFIAILLTPGIFLIQIVNTNMYLINFHIKNIKMCFPKSWVFKISKQHHSGIHYPSQRCEINCIDISKNFTTMLCRRFKKNIFN